MEIDKNSDELNIRTDCFDETELLAAKKKISEGKAFGDDQIAPEILKRVDINDIMLKFCNDALTQLFKKSRTNGKTLTSSQYQKRETFPNLITIEV